LATTSIRVAVDEEPIRLSFHLVIQRCRRSGKACRLAANAEVPIRHVWPAQVPRYAPPPAAILTDAVAADLAAPLPVALVVVVSLGPVEASRSPRVPPRAQAINEPGLHPGVAHAASFHRRDRALRTNAQLNSTPPARR
jgi:hypothetical protein